MELKTQKGKLFLFLFLVLSLPLLQKNLKFIDSGKLGGAVSNSPDVAFSWREWWNDSFQIKKNNYFTDSIGFRQDFIRINNQIDYSLFRKAHAKGVVIGKDNYLYEDGYIKAFCGDGYTGDQEYRLRMTKLKRLQDTFARMGKQLVPIFAPSKARFYPQYFPPHMECAGNHANLYDTHIRLCDSLHISYIDFNGWFKGRRHEGGPLLFSRPGIHWTTFASLQAADSLVRYLEKERHMPMSHPAWSGTTRTIQPIENDKDIINGMNLIFPYLKDTFTYANDLHYTEAPGKPNTIFVGDSFLWTWIYVNFPQNMSNNWEFWYYYNEVYRSGNLPLTHIKEHNCAEALSKADCVIILNTEVNLYNMGSGFIDETYNIYFPGDKLASKQ